MAKLPTVESFGPRPTPRSQRAVAAGRFDIAQRAEAKGLREAAATAGRASATFEKMAVERRREQQRDAATESRSRLADASAQWSTAIIGMDEKYRADPDHATTVERYGKELDVIRADAIKGLDPEAAEIFQRKSEVAGARALSRISIRATAKRHDATRAWMKGALTDLKTSILEAPDILQRNGAIEGATAVITAAEERGAIDAEQAGSIRQAFMKEAGLGLLAMKDDLGQIEALSSGELSEMLDPAERATLLRQVQSRAGGEIRAQSADHFASLQTTGAGMPGLREKAERVLTAKELVAFDRKENLAREYFVFTKATEFAPPQDIVTEVEKLRPEPGSAGFANRQRSFETAQRAAQAIIAARQKDPAAYAMRHPSVVSAFAKIETGDMSLSGAVNVLLQTQDDMGIPAYSRRILSKSQAANIAAGFDAAPAHERPKQMAALQAQYGEHFQPAFAELVKEGLSPETQILGTVLGDITVSRDLSEAISIGRPELRKGLETSDVNDLSRTVRAGVQPFAEVVLLGAITGPRVGQISALTGAIDSLALLYMKRGASASDAATRAVDAVIGKRYIIEDTYYLPRELDGKTIHTGKVAAMAEAKQSRELIEKFDPEPFESAVEKDIELLRERTIRTAVNSGFWVTNENGTGLILMVPFAGGGALPLIDANGNRLIIGFLTATESDVEPIRRDIPAVRRGPGEKAGTLTRPAPTEIPR